MVTKLPMPKRTFQTRLPTSDTTNSCVAIMEGNTTRVIENSEGARTTPSISNVPGPDKPLFFRGAELVSIFPVSIVTHGQALNITCESYAGMMNFGFTGCHSSLPSLQKLAVHAAEALGELEASFLPAPVRRRAVASPDAAAAKARKAAPKKAPKQAPKAASKKAPAKAATKATAVAVKPAARPRRA